MRAAPVALITTILSLAFCAEARAQSTVALTPTTGNPGVAVHVAGTKFAVREAVDVYIDTTDTALVVSSSSGAIAASVTLPASTSPGTHYITAIGRHSGDAATAKFTVSTDWSQFGFGAGHTAYNSLENTVNTTNVASLGTLWHKSGKGGGATPTVVDGRIYISTTSGVTARSATTGGTIWTKESGQVFYGAPTVVNNVVYVGSESSNKFYALNAATGAQIWSKSIGGGVYSSAAVVGDLVYFGCSDNKVYALKTTTGAVVWSHATGAFIDASPTVVNNTVYIGSNDKSFYALNATTGVPVWSYATGGAVESTAAVVSGAIYFGSDDDKVYALKAAGTAPGTLIWSFTTGSEVFQSPAVAQGTVYIGSEDTYVYALNARSGVQQWRTPTGGVMSGVAAANGVVYASSRDDTLYALDAHDGSILWTGEPGAAFLGGPSIANGVLYLNANGADTYAFALGKSNDVLRPNAQPPARWKLRPNMALSVTQ